MKASELRTGNYILGLTGKEYEVVCSIDDKVGTDNQNSYNSNHIDPIPLTEKWLLKFGFIHKNNEFELDDLSIKLPDNIAVLTADDPYCGHFVKQKIQYVHQLQNLYFALTGEELKAG